MVDVVNATRVGGDKATVLVTAASGEQVKAQAVVLVATSGTAAGTTSSPLPVLAQISPVQTDATSRSGTITAGNTAQEMMPANASRKGWSFQNQSAGDLYLRSRGIAGTTDATKDQNSLRVPAGGYFEAPYISVNAMSVIGATTGQAFYAREW